MKADIVLFISSEHPLMQQLQKLFGEECFMRDFVTYRQEREVCNIEAY